MNLYEALSWNDEGSAYFNLRSTNYNLRLLKRRLLLHNNLRLLLIARLLLHYNLRLLISGLLLHNNLGLLLHNHLWLL